MNNNTLSLDKDIDNKICPNNFYLETLSLINFRNHSSLNLKIPKSSLLIYGENGCGKTNILEAISLLTQGKGLRKSKIEDYPFKKGLPNEDENNWGINANFITPDGKVNIGTGPKNNSQNKSRIVRINSQNSSQDE